MRIASQAWLQHLLPKNLLSACIYRIARSRRAWLRIPLTRWFARHYGINMSEAAVPTLGDYACFNDFFTRALKPGSRPLDGDDRTVVSPADGVLTEFGTIDAGRLLQAKGMAYGLRELVGEDGDGCGGARRWPVPHRVSCAAQLPPRARTDGRYPHAHALHSRQSLQREPRDGGFHRGLVLPQRACRLLVRLPEHGPFAVVLVGALNVSSISTFTLGEIDSGAGREWLEASPRLARRGEEIARFNMGSTVVLLFARGALEWDAALTDGQALKMGNALGRLLAGAARAEVAR